MSKLFSSGTPKSEPTIHSGPHEESSDGVLPGQGPGQLPLLRRDRGQDGEAVSLSRAPVRLPRDAARTRTRPWLPSFPRVSREEASQQGWTLKDAMQEAQAYYVSNAASQKPKRETVDFDTRRLAGILAALSPNDPPSTLLSDLKELISVKARGRPETSRTDGAARLVEIRKVSSTCAGLLGSDFNHLESFVALEYPHLRITSDIPVIN